MTTRREFLHRVRSLVASFHDEMKPDEARDVERLVAHGELGEALRALAWILADKEQEIAPETLAEIRELSAGLVEERHMPPSFRTTAES